MKRSASHAAWALAAAVLTTGCASTYSNLMSGSNLGAQEYQPAVYVIPGNESVYQQALGICRQVAVNRQVTSAQEAQLKTITKGVSGLTSGAAAGWELGSLMKNAGLGTSINQSIGVGVGVGLLSSLGSAIASGANRAQTETKAVLLGCLRQVDPAGRNFRVIE